MKFHSHLYKLKYLFSFLLELSVGILSASLMESFTLTLHKWYKEDYSAIVATQNENSLKKISVAF